MGASVETSQTVKYNGRSYIKLTIVVFVWISLKPAIDIYTSAFIKQLPYKSDATSTNFIKLNNVQHTERGSPPKFKYKRIGNIKPGNMSTNVSF